MAFGVDGYPRIETLLMALHMYFMKYSNCKLKLQKLLELLDFKGGKILQNVITRSISMLSSLKRVFFNTAPFW